ncbi:MAG: hypothetical protein P8Z35_19220 [Ignavibacteriaceae bacterium]
MNHDSVTLTKEKIFRLYEQSELSDIMNSDSSVYKRIKKIKTVKNKFPVLYTLVSAGAVAGAVGFFTLSKKYKLF